MTAAIELRDVHKTFRLPHEVHTTLTERILSGFRRTTYERFEALRGVDLVVERGTFIGVIGGNGSGKSTLLKIMSGLLPPDQGEVYVDGSMSALLELGLGFSSELTVRENVELYAAVLGFPRREARQRVDEAISFAGIERFRDAKLKNLSTGMRARLGFATALQAESDILLLDEILAVGDADFQHRCLEVFENLKQRRKTIVLVSHDLGQVQRFCDSAVWIERGRVAAAGDPDAVIARYLHSLDPHAPGAAAHEEADEHAPADEASRRWGDGRVRVVRAWVEDEQGRPTARVRSGDRLVVVAVAEAAEETVQPIMGLGLHSEYGVLVYAANTKWFGARTETVRAGQRIEMRVPLVAALRNGRYTVQVGIADRYSTTFHDVVDGVAAFVVHGSACRQEADFEGRISHVDLQARFATRVLDDEEFAGADTMAPLLSRGGPR
jgi:ABC-type polysaccharide/polyol phosphate transport system ATPase subunit